MTLVSIIIPAYNHAHLLADTLHSALAQTHAALEVIVVDDGSQDNTRGVVAAFAGRVTYLRQENAGVCAARNSGLALAQGEFVLFLDSDDLLAPKAIEIKSALLQEDSRAALAYSAFRYVGEDGRRVLDEAHPKPNGSPLRRLLLRTLGFPPGNALIRRAMLESVGKWDTELSGAADTDLWIRLAHAGHAFAYADVALFDYRILSNSMSRNYTRQINDEFKRLDKFFARPNLPVEIMQLQSCSRAILHLEAATRCYLTNDIDGGKAHLREGFRLAPALAHDRDWLMNWLASFAKEPTQSDPIAVLTRILDNLPPEAGALHHMRREVIGSYHIVAAYAAYDKGDYDTVRQHIMPAVTMRPAILRNHGFLHLWLNAERHAGRSKGAA